MYAPFDIVYLSEYFGKLKRGHEKTQFLALGSLKLYVGGYP